MTNNNKTEKILGEGKKDRFFDSEAINKVNEISKIEIEIKSEIKK